MSAQIKTDDFANLQFSFFDADLNTLADFAGTYLHANRKAGIWLPKLDKKSGIQLDENDERYITSFLEIVGDHLLDQSAKSQDVEAFHWGEPITWDAVDRQLPILRHEVEEIVKDIT